MSKQPKNQNVKNKKNDGFTRFSVTYYSTVIEGLSEQRKEVIKSYGFGSLLNFDKCFVPKKFALWVVKLLNYKSGDIIVNNQVMSFTPEIVHNILDIPLNGDPFPHDPTAGKEWLLNKFGKTSLPPVKYFGNKLLSEEYMPDEDVFVCFILVSLSCFLCPNSSLTPSVKYLGIFEDVKNCHKYNWCKFVLEWLFEHIKNFCKSVAVLGKNKPSIGGCLYMLAVFYLDCVNFGSRQLPPAIPRTLVWKRNLITKYSELDESSDGVYGLRPLLDLTRTCYSKHSVSMHNGSSSLCLNNEFNRQLDVNSGCNLPDSLKLKICKLLDDNSINSSLSVQMNVSSLSALSDEMRASFSVLLEHAYAVDLRTQNVILKLLKLLCDAVPNDFTNNTQADVRATQSVSNGENPPSRHMSEDNNEDNAVPDLPSHRYTPLS
ncbi:hypothetical protein EJB05_00453, partial [Eragrostis curvula]